jgi:hypothetical protein
LCLHVSSVLILFCRRDEITMFNWINDAYWPIWSWTVEKSRRLLNFCESEINQLSAWAVYALRSEFEPNQVISYSSKSKAQEILSFEKVPINRTV